MAPWERLWSPVAHAIVGEGLKTMRGGYGDHVVSQSPTYACLRIR
jgi:hypothetical protein